MALAEFAKPDLFLAATGVGGFAYTFKVARILELVGGTLNAMRVGGVIIAAALALTAIGGPRRLQALWFILLGVGFYMMHGSLQTEVTEVAPAMRGSAVSLHAFCFILGQAVGPIAYGQMLPMLGAATALIAASVVLCANGLIAAHQLTQKQSEATA